MADRRPLPDAPYEQSRTTLREIYGSRKIGGKAGGGAPQSPLDYTPSGRMANALKTAKTKTEAADAVESQFYKPFQPRPIGFGMQPTGRPTAWDRLAASPKGSPEYIANFQSAFSAPGEVTPGFFNTPYGTAEVTAPGQTPITPLAFNLSTPSPLNASALAPYAPKPITSYTPPWKRNQQVPSFMDTVLNGANKWLT